MKKIFALIIFLVFVFTACSETPMIEQSGVQNEETSNNAENSPAGSGKEDSIESTNSEAVSTVITLKWYAETGKVLTLKFTDNKNYAQTNFSRNNPDIKGEVAVYDANEKKCAWSKGAFYKLKDGETLCNFNREETYLEHLEYQYIVINGKEYLFREAPTNTGRPKNTEYEYSFSYDYIFEKDGYLFNLLICEKEKATDIEYHKALLESIEIIIE